MEPVTLEWLSEVAPEMLDIEDSKLGGYVKQRGIEVGATIYILCGSRYTGGK